jgi:predicted DsbA family dithiol-disulfide isomerase
LDLYVMSQCPWGVKAEDVIFPAVKSLEPFVDLNLYFIANVQPNPDGQPETLRFTSLHGEPEVAENLRQVCAQHHFPTRYLDYIGARNTNITDPNWQQAAQEAGIDPGVIERCAGTPEGAALLAENLKAHQTRNATSSPTIDIAGAPYTGSRSLRSITLALCDSLKSKGVTLPTACATAESLPPDPVASSAGCGPAGAPQIAAGGCGGAGAGGCGAGCGGAIAGGCAGGCGAARAGAIAGAGSGSAVAAGIAPSPLVFDIQVVVDPACPVCPLKFMEFLRQVYPAARLHTIRADSKEGGALIERARATGLPLYVLDRTVEQAANFSALKSRYLNVGDVYVVRPDVSIPNVRLDRPRVARHLDLFVNAFAPVTDKVEADLLRFFRETTAKDLTFSLHFIVQEGAQGGSGRAPNAIPGTVRSAAITELDSVAPGPLISAGGPADLKESARQACLFQHASLGDLFTYLACRREDPQNPQRAQMCLAMGKRLTRCTDGREGEALLRQSARMARAFGIRAGPVLVWENRYGPFGFYEFDSLERLVAERR